MSDTATFALADLADTADFARRLAPLLEGGDTLALSGEMGAGKTTFVSSLAAALGSPALVSSPTFTLIHEYRGGRLPIIHADAYRLEGDTRLDTTGLAEYLNDGENLVVIEWAERIAALLPADYLALHLEIAPNDDNARTATLRAHGPRSRALVAVLATGGVM